MNILILCSTFPYPVTRGRKQFRTFHLLKYLSLRHQVTLVTRKDAETKEEEIQKLQNQIAELVVFDFDQNSCGSSLIDKAKQFSKAIKQGTPPNVLNSYSEAMATWINQAIASEKFDAVACEDSADEIYINPQWHKKLGLVLNLNYSEYGKYKQQLATGNSKNELKDQISLRLRKRYEQSYLEKFCTIVTVSNNDKNIIRKLEPDSSICTIPNGVDLNKFPYRITNQGGQNIVFVGNMNNPVNIDAAIFLALEVFPAIRQRYPEASLELVGANPTSGILALNDYSGILVTGEVSCVVEYLHWATVCVIPIRQGYGLRNRTLESMAAGIPIVGSNRALAEFKVDGAGVPLRAMRANTLEEYIYAIGRLFSEPKLRAKISENGRSFVQTEYTWDKVGQKYEQILIDASNK